MLCCGECGVSLELTELHCLGPHDRRADSRKVLREIGKEVDKSEWYMYPQEVNAYYASQSNEIVFPAGILTVRPPTYPPRLACITHVRSVKRFQQPSTSLTLHFFLSP